MPKLTAIAVEKMKPAAERREVPDGLLAGLYLVVQPSGSKSWAVRYRSPLDGRPRKHTIGTYPAFDLGKAREAGAASLRAVAEGRDPASERQDIRARSRHGVGEGDTIERAFQQFMDRYAKVHTREATWQQAQRIFDNEIRDRWRGRKAQSIAKRDILELLDDIVDRGFPILANRTLAIVRRFFNWCIERDILVVSPCAGVKPPAAETSRDRTLTDDELRALWRACDDERYPFGPLVRALMLTGQRVDEVRCANWREFDLKARTWSLPGSRTKNGRDHVVPLSRPVMDILDELPRIKGAAELLFTTTGETPVSGEARAKQRLAAAVKSKERWTLHDVRRTVASGLQRLGFPIEVVEAVLNHKSGTVRGVAAVYARYDYADEKRKALDAWARHVETIVSGKAGKVVPLRRASR